MPVTIQLNDDLAERLQVEAASRELSPEEFAVHLLGAAFGQIEAADQWTTQNSRRLELIRKSRVSGLSSQERIELQQLQAATDQRLEALDDRLQDALGGS
jgi:hypothetical protein